MKILVRGTNWIGDAVMSVPALRELRRQFPDDHITLHTRAWAEGLFQDADFIDEIVSYEPHRWRAKDVADNARFLRDDGYDLAVLLPNSFESALTVALSKIPRRIGYNKDARGLLLTDPIAVPEWKNRDHEVRYYLHLAAETARRVNGREPVVGEIDSSINVSEERKSAARGFLAEHGAKAGRKTVALGVGSTNSRAKRWPAERFAALARRSTLDLGANVILVGSKNERDVTALVASLAGTEVIDLTGETSIGEAAAILAVADAMVTNDMGLAHVAPAVGTPTAVIFGPTDPVTTRPFSPNAIVIRHEVECSPCMLRDCPIDHRCMTRIQVEDVEAVLFQVLEGPAGVQVPV